MRKGKPWSVDEEEQLKKMIQEGGSLAAVAAFFGKTEESINHKMRRLGLKEVGLQIANPSSSKQELPSVEDALETLNDALALSVEPISRNKTDFIPIPRLEAA